MYLTGKTNVTLKIVKALVNTYEVEKPHDDGLLFSASVGYKIGKTLSEKS